MSNGSLLAAQFAELEKQFPILLEEVKSGAGLADWQDAYRFVIYQMGLKILQLFPRDAIGSGPTVEEGGLGQGGGSHFVSFSGDQTANQVIQLACFVLELKKILSPN